MMKRRLMAFALALSLLLTLMPMASAAYTEMSFSDALVTYIKNGEGFRSTPYHDGTGWYIGYGTACQQSDYPGGITEAQGEALLREKMQLFADAVNGFLKKYDTAVTQGQFDAMCGLSYNLGTAWLNINNRLPSMIVAGADNYSEEAIASAFAVYCHVGSVPLEGLIRRRLIETNMFLYDNYSETDLGWNWLILDGNGGELPAGDVACFKSGEVYGSLPVPVREGYTFSGWYTADGLRISESDLVSSNAKVSADWTLGESGEDAGADGDADAGTDTETETPEEEREMVFPDVPAGEWYYDYVERLYGEGVIEGFDDGKFYPAERVTWGQALKLVLLAAGYPEQEPLEVEEGEPASHWASGYLAYAEKKNFVAKGSVTDLDAAVDRNAIADLSAAALELSKPVGMLNPFSDTDRNSVLALYSVGILEGSVENGQRLYKGRDAIKRSEICAVLCRVSDYVDRTLILYAGYRIPINYDLEMCEYDLSLFRSEDGRIYYDDESVDVRYGIDVSYWQGEIDWKKVAADGIDFAMIRVGYRGGQSGELFTDEQFENNMRGALAAGLDVGVYFFSQAITEAEALEEFNYMHERIKGYNVSFPVVFDWEPLGAGTRTNSYDPAMVDKCTVVFCDAAAKAGYTPMTYFNPSMAYLKRDMSQIDRYPGWLANYASVPNYIYDYQMWQYSSSGSVDGIAGRVDMNIAFVDYAK